MTDSRRKKAIQRHRKMRYFIEAADQIISDQGLGALTIRKVSEIAGYNSATLYNYFDSLDHLIYYTHMLKMPVIEKSLEMTPLEAASSDAVMFFWRKFCELAFHETQTIYTLMFSLYSKQFREILIDYIAIFESDLELGMADRLEQLFVNSIFDVVLACFMEFEIEQGLGRHELEELNSFVLTYFQGYLVRKMTLENEMDIELFMNRMTRFMDRIVWSYTIKQRA